MVVGKIDKVQKQFPRFSDFNLNTLWMTHIPSTFHHSSYVSISFSFSQNTSVDRIECYKCFSVLDPECFDDTRYDEFRVDYCPEKGKGKTYPEDKYECFKLTFYNPREYHEMIFWKSKLSYSDAFSQKGYDGNHVFRGCAPVGTDDFLRREANCTIIEYATCTENFCNGLIDNSTD